MLQELLGVLNLFFLHPLMTVDAVKSDSVRLPLDCPVCYFDTYTNKMDHSGQSPWHQRCLILGCPNQPLVQLSPWARTD